VRKEAAGHTVLEVCFKLLERCGRRNFHTGM